ncbi:unnamed protein product [Symbiodinium necroappetens]|uniref:DUF748 domain-containing protein n=1 Tax=Symbiodinium necroappetens TaxID=1628268 RepID=A0A812ZR82_9DINO|nr:unnamed protein product [Symbiodinium necroappetens]
MQTIIYRYRKLIISATAAVALYAVLGFFLAPWLVKTNAIDLVRNNLNAELRLQRVAINPFVLSLTIDGLEFDDPKGMPFARIEQIFVNFQLSSLFRWALSFDEIRVDSPELFLSRDDNGELNIAFLTSGSKTASEEETEAETSSMLPLLVFNFEINNSVLNWNDQVPADPVDTRFGPVNIAVADLNTLSDRIGQQKVVIATEQQGTLSWSGTLQLNPLLSEGRASIKGSHFPLVSAYIKHQIGFDIVDGVADIELNYRVASPPGGEFEATVDDFNLQFKDVLVRTFAGASDFDEADSSRDVLKLPNLELTGGAVRWPEKIVSADGFTISDALLSLLRDETGALDVVPQRAADPEPVAEVDQGSAWRVSLDRLAVRGTSIHLEDQSVLPVAHMGVTSLSIDVTDISNEPGSTFPTKLALLSELGGTVTVDGAVAILPTLLVDLAVAIENLPLAASHPYIKPLADVSLDSGNLELSGRLQSSAADPLRFDGELAVLDFLITETDAGSRLGSWGRFAAKEIAFSSAGQLLSVAELQLNQAYGDIRIAADGSINLGRVEKSDAPPRVESDGDTALPLAITIGKVVIEEAAVDFEDLSLPLPFSAKIADLNGGMSTIATNSSEPSAVELEGKVDEFGFVRVSGSVTPLEISRDTDLKVAFQNVAMPKLSAYTIPFAGREIDNGKVDLDLGYKVTAGELVGDNNIVLRDLQLGDKVEHPGAMNLPLGLAVALLKDADGNIDIDLPVRGNVDDPEFQIGGVVMKALGTLITKIVASPFALLGNLLGVEASELEYLTFLPGRADLTPPEIERAGKLAEALALRPELALELRGASNSAADGLALKAAKLDALIEAQVADATAGDMKTIVTVERQTQILEDIFLSMPSAAESPANLDALRSQYTTVSPETEDTVFDSVAYSAELRRQLIERQAVTDAELTVLANQRSANTRDAITAIAPDLVRRIVVGEPEPGELSDDKMVRMKVTLSVSSESD